MFKKIVFSLPSAFRSFELRLLAVLLVQFLKTALRYRRLGFVREFSSSFMYWSSEISASNFLNSTSRADIWSGADNCVVKVGKQLGKDEKITSKQFVALAISMQDPRTHLDLQRTKTTRSCSVHNLCTQCMAGWMGVAAIQPSLFRTNQYSPMTALSAE